MISSEDKTLYYSTGVKLMRQFPDRGESIIEYIKIKDDEKLITHLKSKLRPEYMITRNKSSDIANNESFQDESNRIHYRIINDNEIISDLIFDIITNIKATKFYAAIGFAFYSGLIMLDPSIRAVTENGGESEPLIGSLQTDGLAIKNHRIDKKTIEYLEKMRHKYNVAIFSRGSEFYHGKYYYISNDKQTYVIVGSTNISKTAFLDNHELDMLFKYEHITLENNKFLHLYSHSK